MGEGDYGFHVSDGLYFKRLDDGSVRLTQLDTSRKEGEDVALLQRVIDARSWASIVAHVSCHGEVDDRFDTARRFHEGET